MSSRTRKRTTSIDRRLFWCWWYKAVQGRGSHGRSRVPGLRRTQSDRVPGLLLFTDSCFVPGCRFCSCVPFCISLVFSFCFSLFIVWCLIRAFFCFLSVCFSCFFLVAHLLSFLLLMLSLLLASITLHWPEIYNLFFAITWLTMCSCPFLFSRCLLRFFQRLSMFIGLIFCFLFWSNVVVLLSVLCCFLAASPPCGHACIV